MSQQEHQSFVRKLMWRAYMNPMLSKFEIQGFEKRGVSKKPRFMSQKYRNHSKPVALQRLKGTR